MLDLNYVKNLVGRHQSKAIEHKKKLETNTGTGWIEIEDIVSYWTHEEVLYLSLNTMDSIRFCLKKVNKEKFIPELKRVISLDTDDLIEAYFYYYRQKCKRGERKTTRMDMEGKASEEYLDRVFPQK